MLQPSNSGSGLQPKKLLVYGAGALVAALVASLVLHAIFGFLSFVVEVIVVVALAVIVLRFLGIGRRR